ncbi:hypothetical protein [Aidingimonas lacisalsi]|uniref:hypothetical protein n=1 Tax=Aidingimonas lacisalsi TaxID=2604086 RepID=UPI0011D18AB4|nr:hypothetical protein [Aidingimonas lacisalsi]
MQRFVVLPTTRTGWLLLAAFVAVIGAGIWPVIGWINRATLLLGLPLIVVWSYLVIFACVAVMAIANHCIEWEDEPHE